MAAVKMRRFCGDSVGLPVAPGKVRHDAVWLKFGASRAASLATAGQLVYSEAEIDGFLFWRRMVQQEG